MKSLTNESEALYNKLDSLDCCKVTAIPQAPGVVYPGKPNKKQETAMYAVPNVEVNATMPDNLETQQRKYLKNRAYEIYYEKQNGIEIEYGISDDTPPQTAEELIERITTKQYVIKDDAPGYFCPIDQLKWRDPKKETDRKGAQEAKKKLKKEFKLMGDEVMTSKLEDAVAAIQKWEAAAV